MSCKFDDTLQAGKPRIPRRSRKEEPSSGAHLDVAVSIFRKNTTPALAEITPCTQIPENIWVTHKVKKTAYLVGGEKTKPTVPGKSVKIPRGTPAPSLVDTL